MVTSSRDNAVHISGPLRRDSTGYGLIFLEKNELHRGNGGCPIHNFNIAKIFDTYIHLRFDESNLRYVKASATWIHESSGGSRRST